MQEGRFGHDDSLSSGFWGSHPKLCVGLAATGAALVAAAGIAIYEHRLAAERVGVVAGDLAPSTASGSIDEAAIAALGPSARQFSDDKHASVDVTTTLVPSPTTVTTVVSAPAEIPTADKLPADGDVIEPATAAAPDTSGTDDTALLASSEATSAPAAANGSGYYNFSGTGYGTGEPAQSANNAPAVSTPNYPAGPGPAPLAFPPFGPSPRPPAPPVPTGKPTDPPTTNLPGPANPAIAHNPPAPPAPPVAGPAGPPDPSGPIALPGGSAGLGSVTLPPAAPAMVPQPTVQPTVVASAPGMLPTSPIMPANPSASGPNLLPIPTSANGWTYFDPVVAIGYNYNLVAGNPNNALTFGITDIRAVTKIGNGQYELYLFDVLDNQFVDAGQQIDAGANGDFNVVDFLKSFSAAQDTEYGITDPDDGLTQFSLRGIDPGAGLDPNDPNAFITGLLFEGQINGNLFITPLAINTATGEDPPVASFEVALPEPGTLSVFALGLFGMALFRRRRGAKISPQSQIGITAI